MKRKLILLLVFSFSLIENIHTLAAVPKKTRLKTSEAKKASSKKSERGKKPIAKKVFKRGSKEEGKEWERRKQDMKPLQLRDLIEENHKLRMQNKSLIEGTNIQEIVNEYDIINESDATNIGADGNSFSSNSSATAKQQAHGAGTGLAAAGKANMEVDPTGTTLGTADLVGAAGIMSAANIASRRNKQNGAVADPANKNNQPKITSPNSSTISNHPIQSADDASVISGLRTAGGYVSDNMPIDPAELPAGSYTIDQHTGQVFINGILDERYGVDLKTGMLFIKGVLFKVQIGARKDLDLREALTKGSNHQNLEQEDEKGLHKYIIGHFRDYWAADKLKTALRALGIESTWIVPYKDGKRVPLKEVIAIVIKQKK